MSKIDKITKLSWLESCFPEWGTYLNEEIAKTVVKDKTVSMWWTGCMGLWIKSDKQTNIAIDLWFGNGKRSQEKLYYEKGHQMRNMSGGILIQPNLRAQPVILDPFSDILIPDLDALLSTHYHGDHIDINLMAAVLKHNKKNIPFIGPKKVCEKWRDWGVPEDRIVEVKPGSKIVVKDITIYALDAFDRTCLVTQDEYSDIRGNFVDDMDLKAVNYVIETSAGKLYHAGDSHYSIRFAKHGKDHKIAVSFGAYGENPPGIADKLTSVDILRMGEALNTDVIIPLHYDIWSNMMADPKEILVLYDMRKYRLEYKFRPFIWEVGGKFTYPTDRDKREYHHRRGFEDSFTEDPNVPYKSIL
ncbi:MAG: L-ascorbate 6-phosphate lactonase [Acholeplasmatales bacterium]|jgi:L-ascorbate 6-phosphate lactonase|nr:L-ascorbate 6-phosphate lactonase [Acholeplasmatales bacterium]